MTPFGPWPGRFQGAVALVTGAASGIGRAAAARLVAEGARVTFADRNTTAVQDAAAPHAATMPCTLDVTDAAAWADALAAVTERFGPPTLLLHAAGVVTTGEPDPVQEWRRVLAVNLEGPVLGNATLLPGMRAAGRGAIVHVASRAARAGTPLAPAYGASKAALEQYTCTVALAEARAGVRCNAVLPGSVDTPMWRPLSGPPGRTREEAIAAGFPHIPLNRLASAEEVAAVALFLLSDEARYVTGASVLVDGGQACA